MGREKVRKVGVVDVVKPLAHPIKTKRPRASRVKIPHRLQRKVQRQPFVNR